MKKILIVLTLFLIQNAFAVEKIYLQQPTGYSYLRPTYNPYSNTYYSPYRNKKTNYNNIKRIQRNNRIRNLTRILNNGALTGYSVPINQNALNLTSPNLTTDLFSTPTGNKGYYRNGYWLNDDGGLSTKTGVRIIYD